MPDHYTLPVTDSLQAFLRGDYRRRIEELEAAIRRVLSLRLTECPGDERLRAVLERGSDEDGDCTCHRPGCQWCSSTPLESKGNDLDS